MTKIYPYIIAFLSGALLLAMYVIKVLKPSIVTDSYIDKLEQNVKKLKQSGENNTQDITHTVDVSSDQPKERKKFLGIIKRKGNKL